MMIGVFGRKAIDDHTKLMRCVCSIKSLFYGAPDSAFDNRPGVYHKKLIGANALNCLDLYVTHRVLFCKVKNQVSFWCTTEQFKIILVAFIGR